LQYTVQFVQKGQIEKREKEPSEPDARRFIPRKDCLGEDMVLESDLPTYPALESEWG